MSEGFEEILTPEDVGSIEDVLGDALSRRDEHTISAGVIDASGGVAEIDMDATEGVAEIDVDATESHATGEDEEPEPVAVVAEPEPVVIAKPRAVPTTQRLVRQCVRAGLMAEARWFANPRGAPPPRARKRLLAANLKQAANVI